MVARFRCINGNMIVHELARARMCQDMWRGWLGKESVSVDAGGDAMHAISLSNQTIAQAVRYSTEDAMGLLGCAE